MEFSLHDGFLNLYPPPNGSVQAHILLAGSEGNSLEGRWKIQEFKYRVLSDSLTDSAKTWWEQFSAMQNKVQSFTPTEFEFRSGRVTRSAPPPAAGFFLAQWNGEFSMGVGVPDSALFDVDVRVIDPATLEMRGRLNGETVTITFAADGTKTLSSDDVARPDYVDGNPVSCPEVPAPWYTPFLVANLR